MLCATKSAHRGRDNTKQRLLDSSILYKYSSRHTTAPLVRRNDMRAELRGLLQPLDLAKSMRNQFFSHAQQAHRYCRSAFCPCTPWKGNPHQHQTTPSTRYSAAKKQQNRAIFRVRCPASSKQNDIGTRAEPCILPPRRVTPSKSDHPPHPSSPLTWDKDIRLSPSRSIAKTLTAHPASRALSTKTS